MNAPPTTNDVPRTAARGGRADRPDARCPCAHARSPYTGRDATERAQRSSRRPRVSHRLEQSAPHRGLDAALARLVGLWSDLAVELPQWFSGELRGSPDDTLFWLQVRLEDVRDGATQALIATTAMQRQLDAELDARLQSARATTGPAGASDAPRSGEVDDARAM